jgi:hypothetical protein
MATWELTTEWKKSSVERQFWYKDDKVIIREEGYRWATFTIECDVIPLTLEELKNDDGYELDYVDVADASWEMVDMIDGCWSETEAGRNCTDEDLEAFEEAWDENYYEGVEELGWTQDDTEYYFTSGPLKLTNTSTGEEFSGSVDPATIVHTIELPTVEVNGKVVDLFKDDTPPLNLKQTAQWPFERPQEGPKVEVDEEPELTDWFPASINPVRVGVYEILTQESINWPYPNKGLWDGKKWNFLDHTVTDWRGLAKDPGVTNGN